MSNERGESLRTVEVIEGDDVRPSTVIETRGRIKKAGCSLCGCKGEGGKGQMLRAEAFSPPSLVLD